jgi:Protein of unknown function (DUF2924)
MRLVGQPEPARQETGGPAAPAAHVASRQAEAGALEARITGLESLATGELRIEWQRLYGATPPTRLSRDLLLRGIAYRVQERALGGLSLNSKRQLRSLGAAAEQHAGAGEPTITLRPGVTLVREWHQRVHTVSVVEDGFDYQGQHYGSLSAIARRITGVAWSGPRFFGIGKTRRARKGDGHG